MLSTGAPLFCCSATAISNNSHLNKPCSAVHRVKLGVPSSLPGVQAWRWGSSLEYKKTSVLQGSQDAPDSSWENRGHAILSRNYPSSGLSSLSLISEICVQIGSKAQTRDTD